MKETKQNKAEAAPPQSGQHTPGPWSVDRFEDDNGHQAACVVGEMGSGYLFGVTCTPGTEIDDTDIANLTVAAAAPELLEALQDVEWTEPASGPAYCPSCRIGRASGHHRDGCKLAAAISKAERRGK